MAYIEITGIDGLMSRLNQSGSMLRPIIREALVMSAEELKGELLEQEKRFKKPTGELGQMITLSGVGHAASASLIDVFYKGDYVGARGSPRRAGFVAAMQEYKNKNPFNKRARKKAAPRINTIITEMIGDANKGLYGGLGGL